MYMEIKKANKKIHTPLNCTLKTSVFHWTFFFSEILVFISILFSWKLDSNKKKIKFLYVFDVLWVLCWNLDIFWSFFCVSVDMVKLFVSHLMYLNMVNRDIFFVKLFARPGTSLKKYNCRFKIIWKFL